MKDIDSMTENLEQTIEKLDKKSTEEVDLLDMHFSMEEENENEDNNKVIKCGSNTDPNKLAFHIARELESNSDCIIIQTMGPKALSKAIMAIVRLKSIIAPYIDGSTIVARFSVRKLQLPDNEERTIVRTRLFPIPDRFVV